MSAGDRSPRRVVILGGGFAGIYAASYLAAADLPERSVEITLVSDRNFFTFTPLLAEVVSGALGREDVTFAHRVQAARRGYRFVEARVEGISAREKRVMTDAGPIAWDVLLIALGSRPRYFGLHDIERHSLPLTTVRHALAIRERVIEAAERASREPDREVRRRLLTFGVAGAGPAGVEVAAEISHLVRNVLPRYYDLGVEPRVTIYHGAERILPGWNETLARAGLDLLRSRGIEVHLNVRVEAFDGSTVRAVEAGPTLDPLCYTLETETLIWTAGTGPDVAAWEATGGEPLPRTAAGHLETDECLRLAGHEDVFVAGDVGSRPDPRTGKPYPPVAPIAISQGVRAAANIENAIVGRPLEPYRAHHAGSIVSLGAGDALVDVLGWTVRGRPAWAIYRTAYLLKLVGARNKLRAATTLALNRVFERDLSRVA